MQRTVESIYKNVLFYFDAYLSTEQFCAGSIQAKGVIAINAVKYFTENIFSATYGTFVTSQNSVSLLLSHEIG